MPFKHLLVIAALGLASWVPLPGCAQPAPATSAATPLAAHVPHLAQPSTGLYTGGQPDDGAWERLKAQGVTMVVNLRSDEEMHGSDEAERVGAAGMTYVHLPVAGAADVDAAHAARLHRILANASGKVLVHCASGNRVGALLAIDAAARRGLDVGAALAYGRSAGLTSLEPRVREVLATLPAADENGVTGMKTCTVHYFRAFVGPTGIHADWPVLPELPARFKDRAGLPLSDTGRVADGYRHTLYVDQAAGKAYVVQQGGIAGRTTVYGPLPVPPCNGDGSSAGE